MIEIVAEQQAKFANYLRENYLSHKTDLRVNFPKLVDDGPSFLTLESGLEKVLTLP